MITEINLPTVKIEERADNRTVFVVEPFYPGHGTTIGNALRRILLSSLPGASVVAVKIAGVDHEFSPIPGVIEDAVQVILNLKKLKFQLNTDEPVTLHLKVSKGGPVLASAIEIPSQVELLTPDQHLATVSDKGTLEMDIQIAPGRGYMASEEMDEGSFSIGTIAVDAAFSPVQRVSFNIEPTRVGEMINYDKLVLDILTDGTVTPEEALKESAQILARQLSIFGANIEDLEVESEKSEATSGNVRDFSIDEINLSIRTTNALQNNNLNKVSDILEVGAEKLSEMKGLGAKALDEISERLEELGISFNKSEE